MMLLAREFCHSNIKDLEQDPCKFRPLPSSRLFYDRQRGKRLGIESALERLLNMPYALGTPASKTNKQYQSADERREAREAGGADYRG